MSGVANSLRIRTASFDDVDALTPLINAAFSVERFFLDRDRTSAQGLRDLLLKGSVFVGEDEAARPVACVYVERRGDRGYFGMLAVDPSRHGRGYGRQLIDAVETWCRSAGCVAVDIRVVNLRTELPPIYRKLGYVERGTEPVEDSDALQPFHFILMSKPL